MEGLIIFFVLIFIGIFIFIPFMIRKAMKSGAQARNFIPDLLRLTGMQLNDQTLSGVYRDFPATVRFGLGVNMGKLIMKGPRPSNQFAGLHGRNTFFQTLHVQLEIPGAGLPPLGIKEKVGILRTDEFLNEIIKQTRMELPELKIPHSLPRVRFYGTDATFATRFADDPELKRLLSDWHFTDIRIGGSSVELILDDNMVMPTFGGKRMSNPGYVVQALDIASRVAVLAKN
ncbi:MAG: hypothetical protein HS115_13850 [Spirochaetales bacterium]|nr:hypothetical protein [Spirochaetales bacterium]